MAELLVHRQSVAVALVAVLHAVLPPTLIFASLYASAAAFDVPFSQQFEYLGVIAVAIAIVILRAPANISEQLLTGRMSLAAGIVLRWVAVMFLLLAIGYATKFSSHFSRRVILSWMLFTPGLLIVSALALRASLRRVLMDPRNARRVVFAGCNEVSVSLAKKIEANSELCMKVEGFFDDRSAERLGLETAVHFLGKLPELAEYVKSRAIDVIFIALPIRHVRRVVDLMDDLRDTTASIYYVPDIFVFDLIQARTNEILGIPVVSMCETPFYGVRGAAKRVTDLAFSLLLLIPGLPIMLLVALLVKLTSPGPVIFKQRRYGLDGHEIMVYKFRSMRVTEDGAHVPQATKDDGRVTPIGRILRRYSLDELPQIFNVLQGRMSLVGPRPHAVAHNEEYRKLIKGYMMRHKVLPGITGLAQVNGCRGETTRLEDMQARVNYDLDYLRHWSPFLDLKILALTVLRLLGDERAY